MRAVLAIQVALAALGLVLAGAQSARLVVGAAQVVAAEDGAGVGAAQTSPVDAAIPLGTTDLAAGLGESRRAAAAIAGAGLTLGTADVATLECARRTGAPTGRANAAGEAATIAGAGHRVVARGIAGEAGVRLGAAERLGATARRPAARRRRGWAAAHTAGGSVRAACPGAAGLGLGAVATVGRPRPGARPPDAGAGQRGVAEGVAARPRVRAAGIRQRAGPPGLVRGEIRILGAGGHATQRVDGAAGAVATVDGRVGRRAGDAWHDAQAIRITLGVEGAALRPAEHWMSGGAAQGPTTQQAEAIATGVAARAAVSITGDRQSQGADRRRRRVGSDRDRRRREPRLAHGNARVRSRAIGRPGRPTPARTHAEGCEDRHNQDPLEHADNDSTPEQSRTWSAR